MAKVKNLDTIENVSRRPLTERAKEFYRIYTFEEVSQAEAGRRAGYKPKNVNVQTNKLMKDPRGQEYMRQLIKEQVAIFDKNQREQAELERAEPLLSVQWVLQNLVDLHDKSKRSVVDMFGNQKMEAPAVAAKCLEMGMKFNNILNGGGEETEEPEVLAISFNTRKPRDEVVITHGKQQS